jgi:hypothetical protein
MLGVALVGALTVGAAPAHADPEGSNRAARLSAAWGGTLDSDIGEAGSLVHPVDYSSVVVRPGRSAEYRRRVADGQADDTRFGFHGPRAAFGAGIISP